MGANHTAEGGAKGKGPNLEGAPREGKVLCHEIAARGGATMRAGAGGIGLSSFFFFFKRQTIYLVLETDY